MSAYRDGALVVPIGEEGAQAARRWSLPNKAHAVAVKMRENGRRVPLPEPYLSPCEYDEGAGRWLTPRGGEWAGDIDDRTVLPSAERVPVSLVLRDYQREALAAWWRGPRNGVIEAPCGAGKTAMGLAAVAAAETPALVLVHTRDLLAQWVDRASAVGLPAVGVAEGRGPTGGRLVVATMQTAARWPRETLASWGAGFGLVIVDEAHHCPCDTLGGLLYRLPGRWRLGLTATPTREDGLTEWMHGHLGPMVARVERARLVEAGAVLAPVVVPMRTGWEPPSGVDYGRMITAATEDDGRNGRILDLVARLVAEGRRVMVQTERRAHAETLATLLAEGGVAAVAVVGETAAKARRERLAAVDKGTARVLCVTQLGDEGLDLPGLDALVLGVPQRRAGALEQRVGRVARPAEGKTGAWVYDLIDEGDAGKLWWSRRKTYQRMGLTIREVM